ncbi:MAG: response regulator transcription factor [Chloroflexota bacterium]
MSRALIITKQAETAKRLQSGLGSLGFACSLADSEGAWEHLAARSPDLVVVEMDGAASHTLLRELSTRKKLPVMALLRREMLDEPGPYFEVADFLVSPFNEKELALRVRRLVGHTGTGQDEVIRCDHLVIDPDKCEVLVEGKPVELTFKEYELLKFLAGHPGRVFTREALLNHVWGYDYYGGDRTVDVHVRRLRSKIETSEHPFIETVRNIGYRFKKKP